MTEIKVKMETNKDIKITNAETGNDYIIKYDDKKISAKSIYQILNYSVGQKYSPKNDSGEIADDKDKKYFEGVYEMISNILKEISDITNENIPQDTN
jgi:hypothetical protein